MPYKIKCWIMVDEEEPEIYPTYSDAECDLTQAEFMQPENKYEIVECDENGEEL